jgi:hypothetical protein
LKLNGTHQLLVHADDVSILGGSVNTIKKKTEALLVGSKKSDLEVNADKTKYMVTSRDQNSGRSHNIMRWAGQVSCMEERRGVYRVLVGKPEGKRPFGRPRGR